MIRKPAAPRPAPPRPAAPRQTFGDRMAAKMAAQQSQTPPPPMVQAAAQQAIAQSRQAAERMAPGTGGRGTLQQYEAMKQQQAGSNIPAFAQQAAQGALGRAPAGVPQYGPQTQMPPAGMGPMGPTGPGTQMSRPAPQAMANAVRASNAGMPLPPAASGLNMSGVGMFKKGGSVKTTRFAEGGGVKEKQEPPIPKATQESMKRQAAQAKTDRKQAEEQKAGEKEVKDNMGRIGFKKGGSVSSASKRADGCAIRGKTRA